MNPQTPWILTTYTTATWTDLVPAVGAPTILNAISISVGSNAASVKIRIVLGDSGSSTVSIVPASALAQTSSYSLDISALTLGIGDALQVQCDVSGVEFAAFGAQ